MDWQSVKNKPVEFRTLSHPSTKISQGTIKMWVNIQSCEVKPENFPVYDIKPKEPEDYEIRVCVFETEGLAMMDAEGTSDAFCRCFIDGESGDKETDTHYRN